MCQLSRQLRHVLVVDPSAAAPAHVVVQPGNTPIDEARASLPAVALVSFSLSAIELLGSPCALLRIKRARTLSAVGSERLRAKE